MKCKNALPVSQQCVNRKVNQRYDEQMTASQMTACIKIMWKYGTENVSSISTMTIYCAHCIEHDFTRFRCSTNRITEVNCIIAYVKWQNERTSLFAPSIPPPLSLVLSVYLILNNSTNLFWHTKRQRAINPFTHSLHSPFSTTQSPIYG